MLSKDELLLITLFMIPVIVLLCVCAVICKRVLKKESDLELPLYHL